MTTVDEARAALLRNGNPPGMVTAFEAAIRAEAGTLDRVTLVKLIEDRVTLVKLIENHVDIGDYSNGGADIEGLADAILARLAGADR